MKMPEAFSMETASAVFIRRACDTTVSCVWHSKMTEQFSHEKGEKNGFSAFF